MLHPSNPTPPTCQQCRIDMTLDRITPCAADYDMWRYICSECSGTFSMVGARIADRASVDERRVVRRHAVTTPATIAAGRKAFACTVHNFSATGASLTLTSRPRLAKNFTLIAAGSTLPCRAVWRRGKQLGIAFN
jgi:hypothetical protein